MQAENGIRNYLLDKMLPDNNISTNFLKTSHNSRRPMTFHHIGRSPIHSLRSLSQYPL